MDTKHTLTMLFIILLLISFWTGAIIILFGAFTEADAKIIMSASVPETDINRCVEVLREAGYINN